MNHYDNYKPYPIPPRETFLTNEISPVLPTSTPPNIELESDPFAEVEIYLPDTFRNAVPVPPAQSIPSDVDETRLMFYAMRQIAREHFEFHVDNSKSFYNQAGNSKVFYYQARYMQDFEDDYQGHEPFSSYYPCYQQMGDKQLRSYFTWRTQVRKGNIADTSLSYAFLYIYELLNNIGVTDPVDGFDKLITFWQAFREYNSLVDRYLLQWIKDYHVYYPLPHSFQDFVDAHHLQIYYPTVFAYESGQHDSFDLYASISKYHIKKSIFYNAQNQELLRDCFYFILQRLRTLCAAKKKRFEDQLFYPMTDEITWIPFCRALFYPVTIQSERQVIISASESYRCSKNNHWSYSTVLLTDCGKHLIGYIMKEMEVNLRKSLKFPHQLRADVSMCDSRTRRKFESMKISLPLLIQQSVAEFYTWYTRKEVSVDTGQLMRIREEALTIQEKLIVPEVAENLAKEVISDESTVAAPVVDIWTGFQTELTQTEFQALTIILQDGDIKGFAQKSSVMLEVLIDSINQKAADYIGDTILEFADTVTIYDEYYEKLTEIVRR